MKPVTARMRSLCLVFSNLRNSLASLAELANPSPSVALSLSLSLFCCCCRCVLNTSAELYPHRKRRETLGTELSARSMLEKRPIIPVGNREEFGTESAGESRRLEAPPSLSRQRRKAFQFSHITSHPRWLRQLSHRANLHNLTSPLCSCVDRDKNKPRRIAGWCRPRKDGGGFFFHCSPVPHRVVGKELDCKRRLDVSNQRCCVVPLGEKDSTVNKLRMLTRRCCGGVFFFFLAAYIVLLASCLFSEKPESMVCGSGRVFQQEVGWREFLLAPC